MKATVTWVERRSFLGRSGTGHAIVMDADPARGGDGSAPSPLELVLMGTGGCTAFDVISILEKMRQPVERCLVELEADRAETDPKVFTRILMRFRVKGRGLDQKAVERAVHLSAEKYCSASIMLGKTAKIDHEVVIEES